MLFGAKCRRGRGRPDPGPFRGRARELSGPVREIRPGGSGVQTKPSLKAACAGGMLFHPGTGEARTIDN